LAIVDPELAVVWVAVDRFTWLFTIWMSIEREWVKVGAPTTPFVGLPK